MFGGKRVNTDVGEKGVNTDVGIERVKNNEHQCCGGRGVYTIET